MKPKLLHQEAMDYSYKARQALVENNHTMAFDLYAKAAELASIVAEYYFDKPELEPTRSILIRSAAFLNLKAGFVSKAQEFIFFGLINIKDEVIRNQLNDALEISISLKNVSVETARREYNYLSVLRQKSIHYILEPSLDSFGTSVSLDMIRDFSNEFLKSLKSYAASTFKKVFNNNEYSDDAEKEFVKLANPLVTASSFGSFKFSIANDFLGRPGEDKKLVELKSNIVTKYHENIFTNPLDDEEIYILKENYSEEEINNIFRPLTKIKSRNSPYTVGYYDMENYNKIIVPKIANEQKKKLLPIQELTKDDIGKLENSIVHSRELGSGRVSKKTIFKEELKSFESEKFIKEIQLKDSSSILLNEEIILNINFDSENGFTLSYPDFAVEVTDTEFQRATDNLNETLYRKIKFIINQHVRNDTDEVLWTYINKIINNPSALK